ncbi:Hypothetical protein NTJ_07414 [Nesidiocoris tenuis]|uniref:Uncharacterized protein n=1 Tax=Nesidiocoris tenuis TaxID=355587 RepID=A0ABN7AUP7_9HEMI|nr:Hypothetical protein NTJ_07414 [Nesidiocoris tenuis]
MPLVFVSAFECQNTIVDALLLHPHGPDCRCSESPQPFFECCVRPNKRHHRSGRRQRWMLFTTSLQNTGQSGLVMGAETPSGSDQMSRTGNRQVLTVDLCSKSTSFSSRRPVVKIVRYPVRGVIVTARPVSRT